MRTDPAQIVWGQRINVWTCIAVCLIGIAILTWVRRQASPVGDPDTQHRECLTQPTGHDSRP